jgi:D-3-phosphoglycerate dehydrogenase
VRVLLADRFPDHHTDRLRQLGHAVTRLPEVSADNLPGALQDHQIVVVRSTRVSSATIDAGASLRLIVRAGSGTDTIDVDAAARRDIAVCNVPGRNALAVAELAVGLLLAIDRRIPEQVGDLRAGRWQKGTYQAADGIAGRAVGIVGLGDIGLAVAQRLAAFETRLHAVASTDRDPERQRRAEQLGMTFVPDISALAGSCDVLTFHVPLSERTRGLIGEPLVSQVPVGAILINTSRGDLVDPATLLPALDERNLRVGLDVHPDEPSASSGVIDTALARHPHVYGTHHVGASTSQAQDAVADGVVEVIAAFDAGKLRNCINRDRLTDVAR